MNADMSVALVVGSLFRDCPPHKPVGTILWPGKRNLLLADKALGAYFASVVEADGWNEERVRVGTCQEAGDPMNVRAIAAMLPTWRHWGRMLMDAGQVPDLDGMFVPPGGYDI